MSYARTLFLSTLLGLAALSAAHAETIAIIGTGQVANALGPMFAEQGHTIIYGSRNPSRDTVRELVARTGAGASAALPAEAAASAEVVMVAVPWDALPDVVRSLGDLTGKILIDPTNPRIVGDDGLRDWAHDTSNAQIAQELAPGARVVKALNTMNWSVCRASVMTSRRRPSSWSSSTPSAWSRSTWDRCATRVWSKACTYSGATRSRSREASTTTCDQRNRTTTTAEY